MLKPRPLLLEAPWGNQQSKKSKRDTSCSSSTSRTFQSKIFSVCKHFYQQSIFQPYGWGAILWAWLFLWLPWRVPRFHWWGRPRWLQWEDWWRRDDGSAASAKERQQQQIVSRRWRWVFQCWRWSRKGCRRSRRVKEAQTGRLRHSWEAQKEKDIGLVTVVVRWWGGWWGHWWCRRWGGLQRRKEVIGDQGGRGGEGITIT